MKHPFPIALGLALVGHVSLVWLSTFHALPQNSQLTPIVVEAAPRIARSVSGPRGSGGTHHSATRSSKLSRLSLRDLGLSPSKFGELTVPDGTEIPEGSGEGGLRGTPLEGIQETVSQDRWFEAIDSALHYPKEFLENDIGGKVDAEFFFAGGRTYVESRSRVRSKSRYLRVHVLQIARRVFPEPVLWAREGKNDFILVCEFQFDLSRSKASASQQGIKPRLLVFYRYGKMPGEWKLGPLRGVGALPAVGIDPNWFVEQVSRKSDIDPLEKYRRDPAW